ncbi:MAG: hypothetical protein DMF09_02905 [Verrucomicrobia bacterium]|nr:MAG: hypothetical protein DMF09_02905 [Verrucomicrobiota bacterium]
MNISEKLLAARMKRPQTSPNKIAPANRKLSTAGPLLDSTEFNFPSHLRVSGIFSQHFIGKLHRGRRRNDSGVAGRFSPAQASVAIV